MKNIAEEFETQYLKNQVAQLQKENQILQRKNEVFEQALLDNSTPLPEKMIQALEVVKNEQLSQMVKFIEVAGGTVKEEDLRWFTLERIFNFINTNGLKIGIFFSSKDGGVGEIINDARRYKAIKARLIPVNESDDPLFAELDTKQTIYQILIPVSDDQDIDLVIDQWPTKAPRLRGPWRY